MPANRGNCDYGYVNGLRVRGDAIRVEVTSYGETMLLRLVNSRLHARGPGSVTERDLAAMLGEGVSAAAILETPRGPVRGLTIDPSSVFSGRTTSPFDPENREILAALTPDDVRKIAMLALTSLSYGENDTAAHAHRLAWIVENMPAADIARWCAALPTGKEIESGGGNLVLNVGYLLRHDRAAAERLLAGSPALTYELYRLFPIALAELILDGLTPAERHELGNLLVTNLMAAEHSPEALTAIASHAIGTGIERARAADPANRPLPPDPFTGRQAPTLPTRVPDRIVDAMASAAVRGEFVTGIVSDDGAESAVFTAALEHIEPEQAMHMLRKLQDVLRELDRLDVVNMIPAAAGVPGGVFHVDAQRLTPQEYDRVLEAMREFFLSLDPESAPARTGGFAALMGPRPAELATAPAVTPAPIIPPLEPAAAGAAPVAAPVPPVDDPATTAPVELGVRGDASTAIGAKLEGMGSRARRGIAVSERRGVGRDSSVYDGDFLDELLDLRGRVTGLPSAFVGALDEALASVGRRPGVVLSQEVLDVVARLTAALAAS